MDAIRRYVPEAAHQRCQVHFLRNARDHVSSTDLQQRVKDGLRNVWTAATREEAEARLARLVTELRPRHARLADWLEQHASDTLAGYSLTDREARRLATTSPTGTPRPSVSRLRLVPRLPRSVGFGPVGFSANQFQSMPFRVSYSVSPRSHRVRTTPAAVHSRKRRCAEDEEQIPVAFSAFH